MNSRKCITTAAVKLVPTSPSCVRPPAPGLFGPKLEQPGSRRSLWWWQCVAERPVKAACTISIQPAAVDAARNESIDLQWQLLCRRNLCCTRLGCLSSEGVDRSRQTQSQTRLLERQHERTGAHTDVCEHGWHSHEPHLSGIRRPLALRGSRPRVRVDFALLDFQPLKFRPPESRLFLYPPVYFAQAFSQRAGGLSRSCVYDEIFKTLSDCAYVSSRGGGTHSRGKEGFNLL